jgi:hypothetical protein
MTVPLKTDVKLRAERKLGGSAGALAPQRLGGVFIRFGVGKGIGKRLVRLRY